MKNVLHLWCWCRSFVLLKLNLCVLKYNKYVTSEQSIVSYFEGESTEEVQVLKCQRSVLFWSSGKLFQPIFTNDSCTVAWWVCTPGYTVQISVNRNMMYCCFKKSNLNEMSKFNIQLSAIKACFVKYFQIWLFFFNLNKNQGKGSTVGTFSPPPPPVQGCGRTYAAFTFLAGDSLWPDAPVLSFCGIVSLDLCYFPLLHFLCSTVQ